MQHIKIKYVFNRRKKLQNDGFGAIDLIGTLAGQRRIKSTGITTLPKYWDKKAERIKSLAPNSEEDNAKLVTFRAYIEKKQISFNLENITFSLDLVDEAFASHVSNNLIEFITAEIEKSRNSVLTISSYNNMVNHLKTYVGQKNIDLSSVNKEFLVGFESSLALRLKSNTVHKIFKNLKVFLKAAVEQNIIQSFPNHTIKKLPVNKEILTLEEVHSIENIAFEDYETTLEQCADMFLFACYTGLRISDVTTLDWKYFKETPEGYTLDFTTKKAKKRALLNLKLLFPDSVVLSKPEAIIEKYKGKSDDFIFPKLSKPTINRHLKTIATLADIKMNLSFKRARDFFGTYMSVKVPITLLMRLMQHSDIKTTMYYVNISDKMIKDGLIKVDWK